MSAKSVEEIKAIPEADRTAEDIAVLIASEAKKSENHTEHMIPQSRLNEEIEKRRKAEEKATQLEKEKQSAATKALEEQGKWKEVAENTQKDLEAAQAKAKQVDEYEATLKETLTSQLADIPTELQSLVPEELSTRQKLQWLSKHKATLVKPSAFDIGAGQKGGGNSGKGKAPELSSEEKQVAQSFGYTDEEYAKFREGVSSSVFEKSETQKQKE